MKAEILQEVLSIFRKKVQGQVALEIQIEGVQEVQATLPHQVGVQVILLLLQTGILQVENPQDSRLI